MYLKKSPQKNGRIYLSIVDGYYDKQRGYTRTVTTQKLGYLDELEKQYDGPIAFFSKKVQELNKEKAKRKMPVSIEFSREEKLERNFTYRKNFGYAVLSEIYHDVEIDKFLNNRQRGTKIDFKCNNMMKLLVYSRLINPAYTANSQTHILPKLFFKSFLKNVISVFIMKAGNLRVRCTSVLLW